jgi:hypothetical protein
VRDGAGSMPAEVRGALIDGESGAETIAAYADRVRHDAISIKDDDVAALIAAGYTEDQVYEITVASALGEGLRRMKAGLAALADSARRSPFTEVEPEFETAPVDEMSALAPADTLAPADVPSEVADETSEPWAPTVVESGAPLVRRSGGA